MLLDFATLELNKKGELYHSLYKIIKEAVECGAIKKGEKLPSIREAAAQLRVSRTTVENAYMRLCIEGIVQSFPQRGYYITDNIPNKDKRTLITENASPIVIYDFSSRKIDTATADIEGWKKVVRRVLWDSDELASYGDNEGEMRLRKALAEYSYKARGVKTELQNIVIGAGVGPLLNILCGLIGRDIKVGFENGGFAEANGIFLDYGIKTVMLESDINGAKINSIEQNEIDVLFLLPSALSKISVNSLYKRRNQYFAWLGAGESRLVIEDDYNGELRYTARAVASFQGMASESTVYIGSFSKLLLPSVRIAYMVLPSFLAQKFDCKKANYNQTCGKIEQMALADYISSGALERNLKRLRRVYYNKSQILISELKSKVPQCIKTVLFESSLTVELQTRLNIKSEEFCMLAEKEGIRLIACNKKGAVRICFAAIPQNEVSMAVERLSSVISKIEKIVSLK